MQLIKNKNDFYIELFILQIYYILSILNPTATLHFLLKNWLQYAMKVKDEKKTRF